MSDEPTVVGRVLRSSTANFSIGCGRLTIPADGAGPAFGALVKAPAGGGQMVYGLIYNLSIEDDPFVRQLVAAGAENEEIVEDQRQNRQVPVVIDVLVVGHGAGNQAYHRLPPQPPGALDRVLVCNQAETVRFTASHGWLRIVLAAAEAPADQLAAAALRKAAEARPPDQRDSYLIGAGRELARWLAMDLVRLDGILTQLHS